MRPSELKEERSLVLQELKAAIEATINEKEDNDKKEILFLRVLDLVACARELATLYKKENGKCFDEVFYRRLCGFVKPNFI